MSTEPQGPLVAGTTQTLWGIFTDDDQGTSVPFPIPFGATVQLKLKLNGGASTTVVATADADQQNNPGKWSYELLVTDIPSAGDLEVQIHLLQGGKIFKTHIDRREVEKTL